MFKHLPSQNFHLDRIIVDKLIEILKVLIRNKTKVKSVQVQIKLVFFVVNMNTPHIFFTEQPELKKKKPSATNDETESPNII